MVFSGVEARASTPTLANIYGCNSQVAIYIYTYTSSFCSAYPTQGHREIESYVRGLGAQGWGHPVWGAKPFWDTITLTHIHKLWKF